MNIYTFIKQLFPTFNESQIQETAQQYTSIGLDSVDEQAVAIMGECKYILSPYKSLKAASIL